MLTEQQVNHFQTFGFLIFRQLFSQDELQTINAEFEPAMEAAFREDPFDGTRRHWLVTMGPDTPFLAGSTPEFSPVVSRPWPVHVTRRWCRNQ